MQGLFTVLSVPELTKHIGFSLLVAETQLKK